MIEIIRTIIFILICGSYKINFLPLFNVLKIILTVFLANVKIFCLWTEY